MSNGIISIIICIIVLAVFAISFFFIIWIVKRNNKFSISDNINNEEIIKLILKRSNINIKYLKNIKNNINITDILDNLNYTKNNYCISILEQIQNSEKNIDDQREKLQSCSYRAKSKIKICKNTIFKENNLILNNYIKIVNKIFDEQNSLTIELICEIQKKIQNTRLKIEKAIANETKEEIEIWKSEIEMLEKYIYLDETFKQIKKNIIQ